MLVSIITPTHKPNTAYLQQAYDSLIAQTDDRWEWVIYLNGGARLADIPQLVADDRVRVIRADCVHQGIGSVKHAAFSQGSGDVLLELDHDDTLEPEAVQHVIEAFVENPGVGFVYSDCSRFRDDARTVAPYSKQHGWPEPYAHESNDGRTRRVTPSFAPSAAALRRIWYAPDHLRAWCRDVYERLGGHDQTLAVCDDHDLMIRTYLNAPMHRIPVPLYNYRMHDPNESGPNRQNALVQSETVRLGRKYAKRLAEREADLRGLRKVDIGGGRYGCRGYTTVDVEGDAEVIHDLRSGIPFPDNSVGVLNASHIIEHLPDKAFTMQEIYRVLAHGGWAFIEVPSTDGRGAFQDPTHVSFWNENSFWYYTRQSHAQYITNHGLRFMEDRLDTTWWEPKEHKVAITHAWLIAVKDGPRLPGLLHI